MRKLVELGLTSEFSQRVMNKRGESFGLEELRANLERGVYAPLGTDGKALIVDTTDLASIDDQRLMQRMRAQIDRARSGENAP